MADEMIDTSQIHPESGKRTAENPNPGDLVSGGKTTPKPFRPDQPQTLGGLTPNNQHPSTLEAPESAPAEHKAWTPETEAQLEQDVLTQEQGEELARNEKARVDAAIDQAAKDQNAT